MTDDSNVGYTVYSMPRVTKEDITSGKVALTVEVSESDSVRYLEKAVKKLSEEKPPKGFRPGKVNIETAKKIYGDMAIYEASVDFIVRATLPEAVKDNDIAFMGSPDISVIKCAPGNPISYKAVFLLAPKVELADHAKIRLEKKAITIDEKRVEGLLTEIQESRASETSVKRAVQEGDHIVADVNMFLDSVPLDSGQMKAQHFIVGKNELWLGFGKELEGLFKGKKKEFSLTLPKTHVQKNIAGKKIEFHVTIKELFERKLPILDDAFAKSLGAFNNLEDLKKQLKDNLILESEKKEQERVENELLTKLVEQSSFTTIPVELIEQEKERVLAETKQMITSRGMEWQGYLDHLKKSEEEIREGFESVAERRIKNNLVLVALAEKRDEKATDEEIIKELEAYARYNPNSVKDEEKTKRIRAHIKVMLSHRKALAGVVQELTHTS